MLPSPQIAAADSSLATRTGSVLVDVTQVIDQQEKTWFGAAIFLLCCTIMLADGFDNQAINYAAPSIIAEWAINRALITPVFNISIAGAISGAILFATLADRYGRRPAAIGAVTLFGGFTLAIPLAHTIAQLSALRFCASLGIGGGMPLAMTLASDFARANRRAFAATLLFAGYTAGSSGGGWLAAVIIPQFGWRSIFLVGGVGGLVIAAALLLWLPESLKFLALRRQEDARILSYARKLRPSAGFAAKTAFTIEQTSVASAANLKQLFSEGRGAMTLWLWFALGFAFATHFFLSQWLTTLLTPEIGFSGAARTQAIFQAGAALSFVFGYLIDRRGIPVVAFAMFGAFVPIAAIGFAPHSSIVMALALISGVLVLGGDVGISALPCLLYPAGIRSTGMGAAFGIGRIGAILGPMFAGLLIWLEMPLAMIFALGALPVLLSGIACVALHATQLRAHGVATNTPAITTS